MYFRIGQGTRNGEGMFVLRYIVNQGTKQSESQRLLHSKRPRHVTYFCSHFSAETVAFQCGTQWSKFREGYVPKAGGCVPKWDAVSMLKYALLVSLAATVLFSSL